MQFFRTDHDGYRIFRGSFCKVQYSERGSVVSVRMIYFKQIGFTHKTCSPEGFGITVDFRGVPVLYQHPPVHQEHSFRKSDRFILIVGDQQRSNPLLTEKVPDITTQLHPKLVIEVAEGFIQKNQPRSWSQ